MSEDKNESIRKLTDYLTHERLFTGSRISRLMGDLKTVANNTSSEKIDAAMAKAVHELLAPEIDRLTEEVEKIKYASSELKIASKEFDELIKALNKNTEAHS